LVPLAMGLECLEYESERRDLSEDVEGEASIKSADCGLSCEWGANALRKLRSTNRKAQRRSLKKEVDGVEVAFMDCTLNFEEVEYTESVPFPEGWVEVFKKGDGAGDYYGLSREFTISVGDVEGIGKNCSVTGEIELEIVVEEDEDEKEFIVYDDQDIGVSC
jgi:hypothetical protein